MQHAQAVGTNDCYGTGLDRSNDIAADAGAFFNHDGFSAWSAGENCSFSERADCHAGEARQAG
jgi:hypothetical protein